MSILNFQKYKFVVSYDKKRENLLGVMIEKYEPLFLRYIDDKNSLNKMEQIFFNDGICDIKKYVVFGVMYNVVMGPNKKTPLEMECLYYLNLAKRFYSKDVFKEILESEMLILAEDAVYESLGVVEGKEKKAFKKLTKRSNIISYINGIFFYKFLGFLKSHIGACNKLYMESSDDEAVINLKEEKRALLDALIERSLLKKNVPRSILNNIRESILSGDIDQEVVPYVEFLADFKKMRKKNEFFFNRFHLLQGLPKRVYLYKQYFLMEDKKRERGFYRLQKD